MLKDSEYRRVITEGIARSCCVACSGCFGIASTRYPGAEREGGTRWFFPAIVFLGPALAKECRDESFPNSESISAEV